MIFVFPQSQINHQWAFFFCLCEKVIAVSMGVTSHIHMEVDQDIWYCFVCAGMKSKSSIEIDGDKEIKDE